MDGTNLTPPIQSPVPKKGGIGKAVKWLIIIGILAGIAYAAYVYFNGASGGLSGKYYPNGDTSMGQYYEFRGKDATLYAMPGLPGNTFKYQIKGDRLIFTAAGQSLEFTISKDRNEFSAGSFMPGIEIKYIKVP